MNENKRGVFSAIDKVIGGFEKYVSVSCLGIIAVIVPVQVFFRYVLQRGILWANELVTILLVLVVMLGSALAFREKCHTDIQGFVNRAPKPLRLTVRIMTNLITLAFLAVILFSSIVHVKGLGAAKTAVLKIPWSICYLAITLGAVLMIYEFLKVMKERILEEPAEE